MTVKEYHLYPDYQITEEEKKSLKVHEIRQLKKERHAAINKVLMENGVKLKIQQRYFVSLPTNEAHEKVHPTGITGGMSQRVHPMISQKIEDLVKEGITDVQEVKRMLNYFVKTDMKENLPSKNNRAYYPTNNDIRNHINVAKTAIQLSKFDQISMKALYEEWTKSGRAGRYFFRPYIKKESTTNHVPSVTNLECMKSTESCSVLNVSETEQSSLSAQTLQDQKTPTDSRQYDSSLPDSNSGTLMTGGRAYGSIRKSLKITEAWPMAAS